MTIAEFLESLTVDFTNDKGELPINERLTDWNNRHFLISLKKEDWDYLLARNWYWTSRVKRILQEQFPSSLLLNPYLSSEGLLASYLAEFSLMSYSPDKIIGITLEDSAVLEKLNEKKKYKDIANYLQQLRIRSFTNYLVNDLNITSLLVPGNYLKATAHFSPFLSQLLLAGWELKQPILVSGNRILSSTDKFEGKMPNLLYSLIHR